MTIIDLEQVHANGNYCHCGDACMKEGNPPSPPQKTTSKQRQRISRKGQTLSFIAQNRHMLCAEVVGRFGRTSFKNYLNIWKGHLSFTFAPDMIRSTIEGGRGCNKCVPVLRGNGTKIAPTGYIFDQPPGGMSWVRGKLAGHVGGHVVLSPEEGVLVTSPGTESSYPRPSQLLNNSDELFHLD